MVMPLTVLDEVSSGHHRPRRPLQLNGSESEDSGEKLVVFEISNRFSKILAGTTLRSRGEL
jgi:hypothetical protein